MYKKFVASFMTALMAAMTLVSPALGATALNTYPTFLGKVGDFYVVVGAKAAASDITGAIDVAANLAQLSYKDTAVSGTTSTGLTGTERKVGIPVSASAAAPASGQIGGASTNQLPNKLRAFHYTGLKDSQFEYRGTKYNYHEEVELQETGTALALTHSLSSPVNGSLKMRVENNATTYKYVFDTTLDSTVFAAYTSANATSYANPVKVNVMGREFSVVAVPSATSFTALVGDVKTLSDGESLKTGDLTFTVKQSFSSSTAKIEITDTAGNVVKLGINTGSTESVSFGGSTYNYRVLSSGATASGVPGYAQVLAGKGDIEKTFNSGSTSTVTQWGDDWRIGGTFGTVGTISANDVISVRYDPSSLTDAKRYLDTGTTFGPPGGYWQLKYAGLSPSSAATITITPVTGQTIYNQTATANQGSKSGLSGFKISSDVAGTLVNGSSGYDEMYVLVNASGNAIAWLGSSAAGTASYVWLGYKDKTTGNTIGVTGFTGAQTGKVIEATSVVNITLSYGGPGAQKTFNLGMDFSNQTLIGEMVVQNSTGLGSAVASFNFQNKTTASTTSAPEFRLGVTTAKSDASDVSARVEGSNQDVSDQVGTVMTDDGVQVVSVKSNVESDRAIVKVPPEVVYGLVQFGKIGEAAATAAGTVKEVVAVTTAVGKLDSEVSASDEAGKHLLLIGGSCANTLVQKLVTAGKIDAKYTCAGGVVGAGWEAKTGYIWVLDGAFATGKQVVVAAGTTRDETRLVTSVLQQYATKLSGITASSVKVTGASVATATVTPA